MKTLLILAYDFPPYVSVGGLRPYSWYKHLKEFGVEPVVVTRQWGNEYGNEFDYIAPGASENTIIEVTEYGTIIRAPFNPNFSQRLLLKYGKGKFTLIRKFITGFFEFGQFFFNIGSKSSVYFAAKKYLKTNKVDAIVATGEPFVLFKYAASLSKIYKIPWFADYRDNWSQSRNRSSSFFLKQFNFYTEKKIMSKATHIFTVSDFVKINISKIGTNTPISILSNGFDDSILEKGLHDKRVKNKTFNIVFSGFVANYYPIDTFFSTISKFIEANNLSNIKIIFIGLKNKERLFQTLKKYSNLKQCIIEYPKMENHKLIEKYFTCDCLLLFNDYYTTGTKIFDYLAVKRKILFCFTDNSVEHELMEYYDVEIDESHSNFNNHVQADLIQKTKSGVLVKDAVHLYQVLDELLQEYESNGYIDCNTFDVEKYSRKSQAYRLAEFVKKVCI